VGLYNRACNIVKKNKVLTAALLYKDEDINVATSITLYKAFTSNYPDFDKLQVFNCKAVLYKINVNYLTTFKPRIRDKTWIFIRIKGNSI
jgi:DNA topoisomerase VI subunit A